MMSQYGSRKRRQGDGEQQGSGDGQSTSSERRGETHRHGASPAAILEGERTGKSAKDSAIKKVFADVQSLYPGFSLDEGHQEVQSPVVSDDEEGDSNHIHSESVFLYTTLPSGKPDYQSSGHVHPPSLFTAYTTCVEETHSKSWSFYEAVYIAKRISKLRDEISRFQQDISQHVSQPQPSRSADIISLMKECLENAKVESAHQDLQRSFIPCSKIYSIMNEQAIQQAIEELMGNDPLRSDGDDPAQLARKIAPSVLVLAEAGREVVQYRCVFAVLILIGKADSIFKFTEHGVNDTDLYQPEFALPEGEVEDESSLRRAYSAFPIPCQDRESWSKQDIRNLRTVRWEVSPLFFFANGSEYNAAPSEPGPPSNQASKLVHYKLRSPEEILPFLNIGRKAATNGAYSHVEFYRLHEDQQEIRRYTTKQKKHPIAVKRLEDKRPSDHPRDLSEKFKTERSVLQRLVSGNRSQHLIKLLATFETPGRNCPNKYHFVFEAADGTIETLWRDETLWGKHADRASLSRWVARQCHGLAEGLAQFHRFQRGPGDDNTKTRGMHGDIKPDNIFWYRDWIVNDDPSVAQGDRGATLGILQIADFGLSNFYSTGSVQDVKYLGTSNDYLAPETELWLCHPPLSDVWELGCLFLDFATWLVTGPKGYEDFTNNRSSRGPFTSRERFSTFERVSKTEVDLTVSSQVWEHAEALFRNREASQFVRDLITLVLDRMLVVESLGSWPRPRVVSGGDGARRIWSHDVEERLRRMLNLQRSDPRYHAPSKPRVNFKLVKRRGLRFKTTEDELREDILGIQGEVKAQVKAKER